MRPLFIHPNFPGPFALVAQYAATKLGWPSTLLTAVDTRHLTLPFAHVNYRLKDDVPAPATFTNPDSLLGLLDHLAAIYRGLRQAPQLRPDLVVGHLSYGTMLYLRNLYPCPFLGYFELYPAPFWGDGLVLRKEFPPTESVRLSNATYHALTLMQLHAVDAAYTPSETQLAMVPAELRSKVRVIPQGVDCQIFQPRPRPAKLGDRAVGPETKVVTYASRGLESVRGFDIFMAVAKRIAERVPDVLFLVIGTEATVHGYEGLHIGKQSFKQWVLSRDQYDLSRFAFLGLPPADQLPAVYNLSDLHVHLTVPHVPSVSLLQAMASGCPILGSDTPPVREYVEDGVHARLAGFDDVDGLTAKALELLARPEQARQLGREARLRVLESYEQTRCLKALTDFYLEHHHPDRAIDQVMASL
ncbi:MAG: glycosyltransferase [Gemmataceae bacterium]